MSDTYGSDRKKPTFIICPDCKDSAKKLFFQNKITKHNSIEAGFCLNCKKIVTKGQIEVIVCH